MPLFLIKSIVGIFFIIVAFFAAFSMLSLMGKADRKTGASQLRKIHKISGWILTALLLIISYLCIRYWAVAGDQISTRAIFHGTLAFALIALLILKLSIVRFYKQFLKFAPVLGMIIFSMSFVVFSLSAGFYFLRMICARTTSPNLSMSQARVSGDAEKGVLHFSNLCSACHHADREETKQGPGLKNILKKERLPSSGQAANIENIKKQLKAPFLAMPSFPNLSEQEIADLLAYLEKL